MEFNIKALESSLGYPPGQRVENDGIAWWYGSGRLTVCAREDTNRQLSILFRNLPEDADIRDVIRKMGGEIKQAAMFKPAAETDHK